ncbi:MBL fold metallo-hydrolase [uncultured Hymenobacter sp.]|uniref:MBL fold metallo-hydrolase n=1 Tax=uncultured Hymenobacter sp. TaxID=170016 RepID=UPI0035CB3C19
MTPKIQARFDGTRYHNPVPTTVMPPGGYAEALWRWARTGTGLREPARPLGPFRPDPTALGAPSEDVALTWLGHSTVLIELNGQRFLTDPVWAERASPTPYVGPKRFFAPPLPLHQLPHLDAILLSHDHYDHLDAQAIRHLAGLNVPFFCPLGVGNVLRSLAGPRARVTEMDWWQETELAPGFKLACTPARHFSGRGLLDRDHTLWASWALLGPRQRVFFGGDSGPFEAGFAAIGQAYGPFDVALLEIGAYDAEWADIHMGPTAALQAYQLLGARQLLPIHWGTFNLAYHAWTEPVERLLAGAAAAGAALLLPRPGQRVLAGSAPLNSGWWR